jgi:hypothetical protein
MKNLTFLPTMLALTIQVMVNGQTQENQARKIRVDIMGNRNATTQPLSTFQNNTNESSLDLLINQANQLKSNQAYLKNEITEIEKKSVLVDIEIINYQSIVNQKNYTSNKQIISHLFSELKHETEKSKKATVLNSEANRLITIAIEMIEEANAQLTNFAKYGGLTNANQNELLAINKQKEAISLLREEFKSNSNSPLLSMNMPQTPENNLTQTKNINSIQTINTKSNTENLSRLITETENLKQTISKIRESAVNKSKNEKEYILAEANSLEKDYLQNKISISEFESQVVYQVYNQNKEIIRNLLNELNINSQNYKKASQLALEAERSIRIGKEMREEAKAQSTLAATYGAMSNAQEQEEQAIQKQNEAKNIVTKHAITQTLVMN